jgi:hypothetical protein
MIGASAIDITPHTTMSFGTRETDASLRECLSHPDYGPLRLLLLQGEVKHLLERIIKGCGKIYIAKVRNSTSLFPSPRIQIVSLD